MIKPRVRRIAVPTELVRSMLRTGRAMQRAGLVVGTAGNLSARLPGGLFLATPSGLPKGRLAARDLLVVDGDGEVVRGRRGLSQTSEMPMHLEVYRRRRDVNAVVHAHPIHAVAWTLVGDELRRRVLPEVVAGLGEIAVTPYAPPSSRENAEAIAQVVADHDAIVLARHGSLTVGATMEEAFERLEVLEHAAHVLAVARTLGAFDDLADDEVADLRDRGRVYRATSRTARV